MHELKIGEAASVLGVSADTVRRLADARKLKTRRTSGGQRLVDGRSLASYLVKRDRSAPGSESSRQSMRNRLPGIVTRVVKDKVAAQVELQVAGQRVVSLLTREAVDTLKLAPGMMAIATVKATNVSVELPPASLRARRPA
jgi:molybdopterin-binding protein